MMIKNKSITFNRVKALMNKTYHLTNVDYRDNLSDYLEVVQDAIHGNPDGLSELINDSFVDAEFEELAYNRKELRDKIVTTFGIEEHEADAIVERYESQINDELYARDKSAPRRDLLNNTRDESIFYDTGLEFEEYDVCNRFNFTVSRIRKKLMIPKGMFDQELKELVANASYGGRLVIYFLDKLTDLVEEDLNQFNIIHFSGQVHIAIIHNGNGSGHDVCINHTFALPFSRKNLFIDKVVKYSYVYDVCGMCHDWCKSTNYQLATLNGVRKPKLSALHAHLERERKLEETFRAGKCTFGDMNIRRHRNTPYINSYPCGNKCTECGTFWID